jgi:hypothetical protein
VGGGDLRDPGRVGRCRFGQHQLLGGFAEFGDEPVESGGSQNLQPALWDAASPATATAHSSDRARAHGGCPRGRPRAERWPPRPGDAAPAASWRARSGQSRDRYVRTLVRQSTRRRTDVPTGSSPDRGPHHGLPPEEGRAWSRSRGRISSSIEEMRMVGKARFELATSRSRTVHSNLAELLPEGRILASGQRPTGRRRGGRRREEAPE